MLVFKGGPITPGLIRRVKASTGALFLNLFPDNPLWMIPFERIEPYDLFFTKERYALRRARAAWASQPLLPAAPLRVRPTTTR